MEPEKKLGRKPIPPEKHRKARILDAEGLDAKQIAKRLKISLPKVYEFLRYPVPEDAEIEVQAAFKEASPNIIRKIQEGL